MKMIVDHTVLESSVSTYYVLLLDYLNIYNILISTFVLNGDSVLFVFREAVLE